jgi:Universal stress protein UspA and related nucleotide-binding proteins
METILDSGAELIVLPASTPEGLTPLADYMVHNQAVPVLLLRPRQDGDLLRPVLMPCDHSPACAGALAFFARTFEPGQVGSMTLLDVAPGGDDPASRARALEDAFARLEEAGFNVSTSSVVGHPVRETLGQLEAGGHSLLLIGSSGKDQVMERLVGSVSERVTRPAPTHVLIVPLGR